MSPASAGSPKGRDAVGGSIAGGDNIAVGVADAPDTSQEEAVEVRARELLAVQLDKDGFTLAADCVRDGYTIGAVSSTALRAIIAALSPNMDHAVGGEPFGYWVEQKYAEPALLRKPAYIPEPSDLRTVTPLYRAAPPVKLDAVREAAEHALTFIENRFSDLSPEKRATVDHLRRALATPSTDTGLDPATVERCAKVAEEFARLVDMPDRIVPAHDETDDWGEVIAHISERVEKRRRLPTGKDIATAIRALAARGQS